MTEGEKKDDLFEDLDKFFAPIQDVDWPETTPARPGHEPEAPEETAALDEPVTGQEEEEPAAENEGRGPKSEEEPAGDMVVEDEDEEEEDEEEEEISAESHTQAPSAYVDLPGPPEDEEEALVSVEERPAVDETPSSEAVEAAAEHFAESVRDEVRLGTDLDTEPETALVDLLAGEAEGEEEEELASDLEEPASPRGVTVTGSGGLGGPSWQEPSTVEVGMGHEPRRMGRDMPAAFVTGLVLAGLALGSIAVGEWAFAWVAGAIVVWALGEFYRAIQKHRYQPATALGLVSGGLVLGAAFFRGEAAMLSMFSLSVFATFLWYMAAPTSHRKGALTNIGVTILGVAYIPLLAGYALVMLKLEDGRGLVLAVIGLTFVYDTAAFVVGSWWGNRPLAPTISPKKSMEGAVGATLVTIAVSVGAVSPQETLEVLNTVSRSVGLAVVVALFAPLGDLAESLLKRDLGIKDMGSVLPGHGGVLDRIDSVLFVAPAAFLFLRVILS
ncbi:MAG: phosphatidate cytidylyltransferase [Actinomycetota bacterium]